MRKIFSNKVFSCIFALSLAVSSANAFCPNMVYAEKAKSDVNLLQSDETSSEGSTEQATDAKKNPTDRLPDTGVSYALDGMSGSPDIVAESAIVMDARSGGILYAKQADEIRYPASITKVMTALLTIENCNMNDTVEFTEKAVNSIEAGSSSAGINAGAKITVEDTLAALMLASANEAGAALAEHIAGSDEAFAKMMTDRAKEIGCNSTQFKNPHGLPNEDHYTTAHDMGLIMKECVKYEEFRKISSTINYTIESDTLTDGKIKLINHAKILREETEYYDSDVVGAKTGFTQVALNTLVTFAERDGIQLVCVILKDHGPDNSYYDTKHLYDWAFDQVRSITPFDGYDLLTSIEEDETFDKKLKKAYNKLDFQYDTSTPLLIGTNFDESTLEKVFRVDEDMESNRVGYVDLKSGNDVVMSMEVTFDASTKDGQSFWKKHSKMSTSDEKEKEENETASEANTSTEDDLKTVKVVNKNSILRKMIFFGIRLIIACALVYFIMQFIRKRELEKKRQERIHQRRKNNSPKGGNGTSNNSSKDGNSSSHNSSKGGNSSSSSNIQRNRRHK